MVAEGEQLTDSLRNAGSAIARNTYFGNAHNVFAKPVVGRVMMVGTGNVPSIND